MDRLFQYLLATFAHSFNALYRKIDEKDVIYTHVPGHVAGFGALVNRIGRGFPCGMACGREYTQVSFRSSDRVDFVEEFLICLIFVHVAGLHKSVRGPRHPSCDEANGRGEDPRTRGAALTSATRGVVRIQLSVLF